MQSCDNDFEGIWFISFLYRWWIRYHCRCQ